jgi:hypothetical protein
VYVASHGTCAAGHVALMHRAQQRSYMWMQGNCGTRPQPLSPDSLRHSGRGLGSLPDSPESVVFAVTCPYCCGVHISSFGLVDYTSANPVLAQVEI